MKTLLLLVAIVAVFLVGCAKPAPGSDQSRMSVDSTGRVTAQDADGNSFNLDAKDKKGPASASPSAQTR